MSPDARALFLRWAMKQRVVASILPNLAANEMARDISVSSFLSGEPFDEYGFMDEFFAKWLERDTKTDDRPSRQKPELLEEYLRLLQVIAVSTLLEGRVDESGYFDIHDEWIVSPVDSDTPVQAIDVLNRSGLVTVDPRDPLSERFRFEPFWFHRLLVERFMEQRKEGFVEHRTERFVKSNK